MGARPEHWGMGAASRGPADWARWGWWPGHAKRRGPADRMCSSSAIHPESQVLPEQREEGSEGTSGGRNDRDMMRVRGSANQGRAAQVSRRARPSERLGASHTLLT